MNSRVKFLFLVLALAVIMEQVEAGWLKKIGKKLEKVGQDLRDKGVGKKIEKAGKDVRDAVQKAAPHIKVAADVYSVLSGVPPVHRLFT